MNDLRWSQGSRDNAPRPTAKAARAGGRGRAAFRPRSLLWPCAVASLGLGTPSAAQETPAEIIAAHVRQQGYGCDKAIDAKRDPKESKPDEAVWTLRCNNAAYRVRLVPDMAANVEQIK